MIKEKENETMPAVFEGFELRKIWHDDE